MYGCDAFDTGRLEGHCVLFSSDLLAVEKNARWGYIDESGETIIEHLYDEAGAFYDESAIVSSGNEYFLIDKEGEHLTDGFESLRRDRGTGMVIYRHNDRFGLMDPEGHALTDALYDAVNDSSEGLFRVRSGSDYGFMDTEGKLAIDLQYEDTADFFSQGVVPVMVDGKYGYIDTEGNEVIEALYDDAYSFDGYERARVRLGDGGDAWSLIDLSGETVVNGSLIESFGGPLYSVTETDDVRLYNEAGNLFTNDLFRSIVTIHGYAVSAEKDDGYTNIVYDSDGTTSVRGPFGYFGEDDATEIVGGPPHDPENVALIEYDVGQANLLYKDETHSFEADEIRPYLHEELVLTSRNNKTGIVDFEGDTVINPLYDDLYLFSDDFFAYRINQLYGIMDREGNTKVPAEYDDFNPLLNIN